MFAAFLSFLRVLFAGLKTVGNSIHQPLTLQEVDAVKLLWQQSFLCLAQRSCASDLDKGDNSCKLLLTDRIHTDKGFLTYCRFVRLRGTLWLNNESIHGVTELQLEMRLGTATVPKSLIFITILYAKLVN